jgi:hypothetical protein
MTASGMTTLDLARPNSSSQPPVDVLVNPRVIVVRSNRVVTDNDNFVGMFLQTGWSVTGRAVYFYLTLVQASSTSSSGSSGAESKTTRAEATTTDASILSIMAPFATSLLARNDALSLSLGEKFAAYIIDHYAPPTLPLVIILLSLKWAHLITHSTCCTGCIVSQLSISCFVWSIIGGGDFSYRFQG